MFPWIMLVLMFLAFSFLPKDQARIVVFFLMGLGVLWDYKIFKKYLPEFEKKLKNKEVLENASRAIDELRYIDRISRIWTSNNPNDVWEVKEEKEK